MFGPLLIEAKLVGPLITRSDPIHLDGLLARAWVVRHCKGRQITRLDDLSALQAPHLPLARLEVDGRCVWLASADAPVGHQAPSVVWQTKRRDAEDWDRLARPVNVAAGPAKNVLLRTGAALVTGLRWWAWGDRREVVRALRLLWGHGDAICGSVGSSRRSGSGQIERWSCVAAKHSPFEVFASDGILRRHLPVDWLEQIECPRRGACEPPYWHPQRQVGTAAVGSSARLTLAVRRALSELETT